MSVKRTAKQLKIVIRQQGAYFPVLGACVLVVFPAVILGYYLPKDFKENLLLLKLIQLMVPMLCAFWEVQFLHMWITKKGRELLFFTEPHPWKYALALNLFFDILALCAYGILYLFGMNTEREGIRIFLLCLILQGAAMLFLNMFQSVALALGAAEALLCALCFYGKSPFYWSLENPFAAKYHLVQISLTAVVVLSAVNILIFRFGKKV